MAVFLICEFDPFHFGHEYIIKTAKERFPDQILVCVMSGNFVQRGLAATYDKYARAECALLSGADLVLSIPFPFCISSAEYFARGALSVVRGLYQSGDRLIFGSECADAEELCLVSKRLDGSAFKDAVAEYIKKENAPYAEARQAVYEALYGGSAPLRSPNDILAAEYIKEGKKLCPGLLFEPVKRRGEFLSSSDIRKRDGMASLLPEYAHGVLKDLSRRDIRYAEKILLSHLRTDPYKYAADGENGLINRIAAASYSADSYVSVTSAAASPQFTDARIRRVILYSYFGISKSVLKELPLYTLLLGADEKGLGFLSAKRKDRAITVITKPSAVKSLSSEVRKQYGYELCADSLYAFCADPPARHGEFLKRSPVIIKNKEHSDV